MNTILLAVAATTAATTAAATSGSPASETPVWSHLDAELAGLAARSDSQPGGPRVGALIRSSFDWSGDDIHQSSGGEDLQGWRFQDVRAWAEGDVGDLAWRLMFDFADSNGIPSGSNSSGIGSATLLDAYARWQCDSGLALWWGQFKCPVLRSSTVSPDSLILIDRTRVGQFFDAPGAWQPGLALTWDNESFHAKLAVQNGSDGTDEDVGTVLRGEYKWRGGAGHDETAYGAPDECRGTLGLAWFNNDDEDAGGQKFGSVVAVDAAATYRGFSAFVELADFDDELGGKTINAEEVLAGASPDGGTPWSVTLGYMIQPEVWEAALRYQDLDDGDDTTIVGGGLNWYQSGHQTKWQLNISQYEDDGDDGVLVQVGLTIGSDS